MFIKYEKLTRKITEFQTFPLDKCLLSDGIDEEFGIEYQVKELDADRGAEVVEGKEAGKDVTYASNGQIVVTDPAPEPVSE